MGVTFFGSDVFLETLARVRFPKTRATTVEVDVSGERYRLLEVGRLGSFVTQAPFLDFHSSLPARDGAARDRVRWLPRTQREVVTIDAWHTRPDPHMEIAPLIDWSLFPSFDEFEAHVKLKRKVWAQESRRYTKRLSEHAGACEFVYDADPRGLLDLCMEWKSAQYVASGLPDLFARQSNRELFRALSRNGNLVVSALFAGGRPAAIHMGAVHEERFLYWVPAYDRELASFSPGRLLLNHLLRESMERGHRSFELLLGDEAYKYYFATHVRLIGAAGSEPIWSLAGQRARDVIRSLTRRVPGLHSRVRAAKRRLLPP